MSVRERWWGGVAAALALGCGAGAGTTLPTVEFSAPAGSGEPNLTHTPDGAAVLTWLEPVEGGSHALRVAVRTAGRWSAPRTIVAGDSFFVNWADAAGLTPIRQ